MSARKSAENTNWLRVLLCIAPAVCLGGCIDYVKRRDMVTLGAGDAQNWNKVVHTADPWPPYVADTQIAGDGQRTARVMQRYTTGAGAAGSTRGPYQNRAQASEPARAC